MTTYHCFRELNSLLIRNITSFYLLRSITVSACLLVEVNQPLEYITGVKDGIRVCCVCYYTPPGCMECYITFYLRQHCLIYR